jgi:hypothetical protein
MLLSWVSGPWRWLVADKPSWQSNGPSVRFVSPFDPLRHLPFNAMAVAHFTRGGYEQAAAASRNAIESNHIFIAFLAYCLQITLQRRLHALAPGLTARSALEKFAAVQMIDVHLPTTDGRELLLTRYTQPEPELRLLIQQLKLQLPPQPPPRIATANVPSQLL